LSAAMVEEATRLLPEDLAGRVSFRVADADALPFDDGSFDLVVLLNMIPFFEELARVTALGGSVVVASSSGPETPIYVPPATLRARFAPLGFDSFDEVRAGEGTAFIARRQPA
jgi:ubiquinone/menaquinone biosynthesis C-methylase UbiE